jgi:hypothetical protein
MELILLFAVLVCPIAMGAMMFLMMRGMRSHGASHERTEEEKAPVSRLKTGHHES